MVETTKPVCNFFRFRECNTGQYLLTNDTGNYQLLSAADFKLLQEKPEALPENILEVLEAKGFLYSAAAEDVCLQKLKNRYRFTGQGPGLHILVVTLRCDHKCAYCQASRQDLQSSGYDMDPETAERCCDFILQTTARRLCVEFQGGEPLVNFPVVQHIIRYMQKHKQDKQIIFSLVTNLNLMDEAKLAFLLDNRVSICTSLDGPAQLHNKYRLLPAGDSHANVLHWIKRITDENRKREACYEKFNKVNALLTTTRESKPFSREIIDLYLGLGLESIHLRPLNPFGYGKKLDRGGNFSGGDFIAFYRDTLDYILELNRQGSHFYEKTAQIILRKILLQQDPGFLDLRSPCGAGIGQLAYHYDGSIFTCDEGRMLSAAGDNLFRLGHVNSSSYHEVMRSDTVRNMCIASCLEALPGCHDCVYHSYCGVCPVYNYVEQGSLFGHMPTNERCRMLTGIFDYLFERLPGYQDVFRKWAEATCDPFQWETGEPDFIPAASEYRA